jgi:uncharacterized protein with HEPN domain
MNKDDEIILDLLKAINLIMEFTENMNLVEFLNDVKTQSSVLYQIVIIGEAINRLSSEFAQTYPEIPINRIRGMRNRVVHEYKEVDLEILWEVTQTSIPELLALLKPLIPKDVG